MKADLTRDTFAPERHYRRVIQQQGRVPLDADWNEQAQIQEHLDETESIDVIGPAGFPQGPSFKLSASPDQRDLLLGDGNGYVDGILAENQNRAVEVLAFPASNQVTLRTLVFDAVALRPGEWLYIDDPVVNDPSKLFRVGAVDPSTQTLTLIGSLPAALSPARTVVKRVAGYIVQPDWYFPDNVTVPSPPGLPSWGLTDGQYLAYLDVWRRHVTALEDPRLREVALGGPDTCTRAKTVWQLKLAPIAQGQPTDCTTPLPAPLSTGRLSARARQPSTGDTPCVISPSARYRSLENQLYRVEIHDPGAVGTATFKFSRDNGMVMVSWLSQSGTDLTMSSLGRDKVLGFDSGQWIELVDDSADESARPGTLAKITKVDPATNTITIDPASVYPPPSPTTRGYDITKFPLNPRVRRWDHVSVAAVLTVSRPPGDGFVDLEEGVQVRFEDGDYESGDYWLIPARTTLADVEWPRNEAGTPLPQARRGIEHHVARLGVVTIGGGLVQGVTDCRPQFPPLTQLPPSTGGGCCCGVMIQPGDDPQTMIDNAIGKAAGANIDGLTIEFAAGTFQLSQPIRIAAPADGGGGHLVVRGCGAATRLVAAKQENVLRIVGWQSATVTDLYAEAGITAAGSGAKHRPDQEPPPAADINRHLLGVVYIRNCGLARAERLQLKCGAGPRRAASCLTVWNDVATVRIFFSRYSAESTVRDCHFLVGHMQVGVLLVNQTRATVEDNVVETYALRQDAIVAITTSPLYLGIYRRLIAKDLVVAQAGYDHSVIDGFTNHNFNVGGTRVLFRADSGLGNAWNNVLRTEGQKAFRFLAETPATRAATAEAHKTTEQPKTTKPAETPEAKPTRRARTAPSATAKPAEKTAADTTAADKTAAARSQPLRATLQTPAGMTRPQQKQALKVRSRFNKMAYAVLNAVVDPNARTTLTPQQLKPFKDWLAAQQASFSATSSAGIVIAGQVGEELRVRDNTITGALDGVHLGFSHSGGPDDPRDFGGRIQIIGNTIEIVVGLDTQRAMHRGVFVGNARSVAIERNRVVVTLLTKTPPIIDGISVWGEEGPMVIVAENEVIGATVGVRMIVNGSQTTPQWRAINNATFGCQSHVLAWPGVTLTGNLP